MSLGNGNPKNGDKGSNFNYELKVLQGLQAIAVALETGNFTNITYENLYIAHNEATLKPGKFYQIIDFENIYDIPLYNVIGEQYYQAESRNVGGEAIVVQAIGTDTLSPIAFIPSKPNVYIEYDVTASSTPISNTKTRGKITRYVDVSTGNSGYTDLDYVEYGRFSTYIPNGALTGTNFEFSLNDGGSTGHLVCNNGDALFATEISLGSIINLGNDGNGIDYINVYVEQILSDNYLIFTSEPGIGGGHSPNTVYNTVLLPNVFSWKETYMGQYDREGFYNYYKTVYSGSQNITLGKYNPENPFYLDNNIIGIGNSCTNITFGNGSQNNTLGAGNNLNVSLGYSNFFGYSAFNNDLTGVISENIFTEGFQECQIHANMYNNTITGNFNSNTISGRFFFNKIVSNFYSNVINCPEDFTNNIFSDDFNRNNITSRSFSNNTGEAFYSNVILQGPVKNNFFGSDFSFNTINAIRDGLIYNTFGKGSSRNYFLDFINNQFNAVECYNNTFQCSVAGMDFTSATLIANYDYSKTVMQASGISTPILWYLDVTNTPQYDIVTA